MSLSTPIIPFPQLFHFHSIWPDLSLNKVCRVLMASSTIPQFAILNPFNITQTPHSSS
jgi:hypothetical protein